MKKNITLTKKNKQTITLTKKEQKPIRKVNPKTLAKKNSIKKATT